MHWTRLLALFAMAFAVLGCNGGSKPVPVKPPGQEQIKPILETVAKNGQLDSGIMAVEEQLQAMKKTDSAKAETLLTDLQQLKAAKTPDAVKTKAKEMLGKL